VSGIAVLALLQEAEGAHGAAGAPTSPFDVNLGLVIWTWIVFGLLFFLLKKFAWPMLVQATEDRERTIQRQLEEAARANAEAAALLEQQTRLLADSRSSAQSMIAEARAAAERERALAVERTRAETDEQIERARREIATERERAVVELRREAVELSLAAASKLVGERMDSANDRRLVTEYLSSLEKQR
jgi:F-type H+-transporting ATPase subunit b